MVYNLSEDSNLCGPMTFMGALGEAREDERFDFQFAFFSSIRK